MYLSIQDCCVWAKWSPLQEKSNKFYIKLELTTNWTSVVFTPPVWEQWAPRMCLSMSFKWARKVFLIRRLRAQLESPIKITLEEVSSPPAASSCRSNHVTHYVTHHMIHHVTHHMTQQNKCSKESLTLCYSK